MSKQRFHANRRALSSRKKLGNRLTSRRREDPRPSQHREGSVFTKHYSSINLQSATAKQAGILYRSAVENLDAALRHMQKQSYAKAAEILQKLVNGPVQEVANRARIHLHHCENRLSPSVFAPKSAEDYYNLGVFELNARALDLAVEHLGKAAKMKPNQEHIRYALASAYALQGDVDSALEHLSKAIALRPANRFQVRLDRDFASLADSSRFRQLVNAHSSKDKN
jgi:tetratricopeptide (TPR) repeat protein